MKRLFTAAMGFCALSITAHANTLFPGSAMVTPDLLALTGLTLVASETGVVLNSQNFYGDSERSRVRWTNSVSLYRLRLPV